LTFKPDGDGERKLIIDSKAAERLAGYMRQVFAFEPEANFWYRYSGMHWKVVHGSVIDEFITTALFVGCKPLGFKRTYLISVMDILRKSNLLPLPTVPPHDIAFRNGLFDPHTGILTPPAPERAATWVIPHDHAPGGQCPVFMAWLEKATSGNRDKQLMLRAFIAAALTGRADLQRFVYMLGPGGSGKSTFIRIMVQILGPDNCITTDLKNLEQNRFETARVYGKRLTVITDTDKYGGAVNNLKAMTGQDPLRNEQKHKQQGNSFIYAGMVLMAGNEPLQATDYTSGFIRRQLVIMFDRVITAAEKRAFIKKGGEAQLIREIPAIINWALELDAESVTATFMNPPEAVMTASFEAQNDQNPILKWATETLIPNPGNRVFVGNCKEGRTKGEAIVFYCESDFKLYPSYLAWCKRARREPVSLPRFSPLLIDVLRNALGVEGVEKKRHGEGIFLTGIAINEEQAVRHWADYGSVPVEA
jgi:putative DNA primase/helicase